MRLQEYLKEHGEKPLEFAERIGVSIHAIRKWISKERIPRPETQALINKITKGVVTPNDWVL